MTSLVEPSELLKWCRIPAEDLSRHPAAKVRIRILPTPTDLYLDFAREVTQEIKRHNDSDEPTRLILPCGPRGPISHLTRSINEQRLSLKRVHIFHMDDHLDWQGRPIPTEHPFSYRGWMDRNFYGEILPDLNAPASQRHWPSPFDPDAIGQTIEAVGGIDTAYGGIGYRGHLAYNEPPRSPWYTISAEEFKQSRTRVLCLNDDTLIALSQRAAGGCTQIVPPMAITLGMKEILSARRIRLYSETGAWKQAALRVLLFGPVTVEYPSTFCQEHLDFLVTVDAATAEPPLIAADEQMQRLIKA